MKRFEYKTEKYWSGGGDFYLDDKLNLEGADGWEAIKIEEDDSFFIVNFKREIIED